MLGGSDTNNRSLEKKYFRWVFPFRASRDFFCSSISSRQCRMQVFRFQSFDWHWRLSYTKVKFNYYSAFIYSVSHSTCVMFATEIKSYLLWKLRYKAKIIYMSHHAMSPPFLTRICQYRLNNNDRLTVHCSVLILKPNFDDAGQQFRVSLMGYSNILWLFIYNIIIVNNNIFGGTRRKWSVMSFAPATTI